MGDGVERRAKAANPHRGEVELVVDGQAYVLRLTLGALAELEADLGEGDLISLVERFETARFSASDLLALLAAGVRGGQVDLTAQALAEGAIDGGPQEAARVAGRLLALSFAGAT